MDDASNLGRMVMPKRPKLVPHRDVDLLRRDGTHEVEIESRDVNSIADAVLIAPREHDSDRGTERERAQETEGRAVGKHEIREQYIDVLLQGAGARLLTGMRAHDFPTSAHEREFQECGAFAVIEDSEHHRRVGREHDHLST